MDTHYHKLTAGINQPPATAEQIFPLGNIHADIAKAKLQLEALLTSILKMEANAPMDVLIKEIQLRIYEIEFELLAFDSAAEKLRKELEVIYAKGPESSGAILISGEPEREKYLKSVEVANQLAVELRKKVYENNEILSSLKGASVDVQVALYDYEWRICSLGYQHNRGNWQKSINVGDFGSKSLYVSVGDELAQYESWLYSLQESYRHFWTVENLYIIIEKNQQALVFVSQSTDTDLSRCTITSVASSGQYHQFNSTILKINKALVLLNTTEPDSKLRDKYPDYAQGTSDSQFQYVRVNSLQWSIQPPAQGNQFVITRDGVVIPHREIYPTYSCTCDLPDTSFHAVKTIRE